MIYVHCFYIIGMVENGLKESACYSLHKQLSPTLTVTKVDPESQDSEEFLEVHYTDSTRNADVSESSQKGTVSPGQSVELDCGETSASEGQDVSGDRPVSDSSVSGDRPPSGSSQSSICGVHSRNRHRSDGSARDMELVVHMGTACRSRRSTNQRSRIICDTDDALEHSTSNKEITSEKAKRNSQASQKRHSSHEDKHRSRLSDSGGRPRTRSESDAFDITKITHAEHVQVSTPSKPDNQDHTSGRQNSSGSHSESHDLDPIQEREGSGSQTEAQKSMEDLLEAEECFNWDEDKLLLEIDEALEDTDGKPRNGSPSLVDLLPEDNTPGLHGNQDSSSQHGKASDKNGSSQDNNNKESRPASISSSSGLSAKAAEIRDRISAAVWSPTRESQPLTKRENVELKTLDTTPGATITSLDTDAYGLPLAIFTKVSGTWKFNFFDAILAVALTQFWQLFTTTNCK